MAASVTYPSREQHSIPVRAIVCRKDERVAEQEQAESQTDMCDAASSDAWFQRLNELLGLFIDRHFEMLTSSVLNTKTNSWLSLRKKCPAEALSWVCSTLVARLAKCNKTAVHSLWLFIKTLKIYEPHTNHKSWSLIMNRITSKSLQLIKGKNLLL